MNVYTTFYDHIFAVCIYVAPLLTHLGSHLAYVCLHCCSWLLCMDFVDAWLYLYTYSEA